MRYILTRCSWIATHIVCASENSKNKQYCGTLARFLHRDKRTLKQLLLVKTQIACQSFLEGVLRSASFYIHNVWISKVPSLDSQGILKRTGWYFIGKEHFLHHHEACEHHYHHSSKIENEKSNVGTHYLSLSIGSYHNEHTLQCGHIHTEDPSSVSVWLWLSLPPAMNSIWAPAHASSIPAKPQLPNWELNQDTHTCAKGLTLYNDCVLLVGVRLLFALCFLFHRISLNYHCFFNLCTLHLLIFHSRWWYLDHGHRFTLCLICSWNWHQFSLSTPLLTWWEFLTVGQILCWLHFWGLRPCYGGNHASAKMDCLLRPLEKWLKMRPKMHNDSDLQVEQRQKGDIPFDDLPAKRSESANHNQLVGEAWIWTTSGLLAELLPQTQRRKAKRGYQK